MKKWIWQHENYPNYTYNKDYLNDSINKIKKLENELNSLFYSLDLKEQKELIAKSVASELIYSFKIENIDLEEDILLKNIKDDLSENGNYENSPYAGLAHLALNPRFDRDAVDIRRMRTWHSLLFSDNTHRFKHIKIGAFRDKSVCVGHYENSGFVIDYEAPPSEMCESLVNNLLENLKNSDENEFIKAALAHFAFVIIHPYDDGNGRSTRLLADFFTSKECKIISHSPIIYIRRREYYTLLKNCQSLKNPNPMDITKWISWYLEISTNALEIGIDELKFRFN